MEVETNESIGSELTDGKTSRQRVGASAMSYKFQRLREKIRAAIASGELTGKLPGERALARRFHVNAKTLSKALTDLAAEGVLDRSIGRGTYVKGSAPAAPSQGRWLVLADMGHADSSLINSLRAANSDLHVAVGLGEMRPSFLNQFSAVIDAGSDTPEPFLRDLVVRNMPVVAVNREPKTYSMHCVLMDVALGASRVGRDMMLAGHRRLAAVEPVGSTVLSSALRQTVTRFSPDATVDACTPGEVRNMIDAGVTAIVCGSSASAAQVRAELDRAGIHVPSQVSVMAVGSTGDVPPCSGYFCSARQLADAVVGLLNEATGSRPATLWLAGAWHDLGTTGSTAPIPDEDGQRTTRRRAGLRNLRFQI